MKVLEMNVAVQGKDGRYFFLALFSHMNCNGKSNGKSRFDKNCLLLAALAKYNTASEYALDVMGIYFLELILLALIFCYSVGVLRSKSFTVHATENVTIFASYVIMNV